MKVLKFELGDLAMWKGEEVLVVRATNENGAAVVRYKEIIVSQGELKPIGANTILEERG